MAIRIGFIYLLFIILISFGTIGGCGEEGRINLAGEQDIVVPLDDDADDIIAEIPGNWDVNCNQITDPLGIINGNLGNPFNLQIVITIDPLTDQATNMINFLALPDLFELDGDIVDLGNDTWEANAEGSGFLGDSNPTAANIVTKAEGLIFVIDEEGHPILEDSVLRLNFPELPGNLASSTAGCTGEKIEE